MWELHLVCTSASGQALGMLPPWKLLSRKTILHRFITEQGPFTWNHYNMLKFGSTASFSVGNCCSKQPGSNPWSHSGAHILSNRDPSGWTQTTKIIVSAGPAYICIRESTREASRLTYKGLGLRPILISKMEAILQPPSEFLDKFWC